MGFGKDGTGIIAYEVIAMAPGALAARDCIAGFGSAFDVMVEDFRILRSEIHWGTRTGTLGDAFTWGIAGGELTTQEIEECLESLPINRNDNVSHERASRPVWPLGVVVVGDDPSTSGADPAISKIRWTFSQPDGWQWWIYNHTQLAMTTGAIMDLLVKHFGVWVT